MNKPGNSYLFSYNRFRLCLIRRRNNPMLAFTVPGWVAAHVPFFRRVPGQELLTGSATTRRRQMGKYFLAWLLGVPALVLVLIYFFMR